MANFHQLTTLHDVELLTRLCSEEDDAALYEEFVKRFHDDLREECRKICKRRGLDSQVGEQIAHECFERVKKYKTIKIDGVRIKSSRKSVIAYLYKIAINLINDHQQKANHDTTPHKTYFDELLEVGGDGKSPEELFALKERTLTIFGKLNEKERKVIITDLEYKRDKSHTYLPDDINELLAKELGVKKDGVRKIRQRAIQKLKIAINAD